MQHPGELKILTEAEVEWDRKEIHVQACHFNPHTAAYQARLGEDKFREETVEIYALAYRRGDAFPDVIVNTRSDGTYDVLSGFHRLNAMHREGIKKCWALVLKVDHQKADLLAREMNSVQSIQGMTRAQRVAQAIVLIQRHGYSQGEAARRMGINVDSVGQELRALEVRKRVGDAANLTQMTTTELAEFHRVHNDNALRALVKVAAEARIGTTAIRPVISDLARLRTEEAQLACINSFRQTPLVQDRLARLRKGDTNGPRTYRPYSKLTHHVRAATNLIQKHKTPARMQMTMDEMAVLRSVVQDFQDAATAFMTADVVLSNGR